MDKDEMIAALARMSITDAAMVTAASVARLGAAEGGEDVENEFASAVRTLGAEEDLRANLNTGGESIYFVINSLDDNMFDFDIVASDDDDDTTD